MLPSTGSARWLAEHGCFGAMRRQNLGAHLVVTLYSFYTFLQMLFLGVFMTSWLILSFVFLVFFRGGCLFCIKTTSVGIVISNNGISNEEALEENVGAGRGCLFLRCSSKQTTTDAWSCQSLVAGIYNSRLLALHCLQGGGTQERQVVQFTGCGKMCVSHLIYIIRRKP